MDNRRLSIIIPALNEENTLHACIASALRLDPMEVIVVDGGSSDRTRQVALDAGAVVISSPRGRGIQMNRGASQAGGDILLFLHADSFLSADNSGILFQTVDNGYAGGFFRLQFDDRSLSTRLVCVFANARSRLFSLPYGDQAVFIKRDIFKRIGGFRDYPFLEDIDIVLRVKKHGRLKYLSPSVTASARRIRRPFPLSPILLSIRNMFLVILFLSGVRPDRLAGFYR
jgi:rSAM/selenodomain-associated transferase 2